MSACVQLVLHVVGGVDPDLGERLDNAGLRSGAVRVGAGGARLVPIAGGAAEEPLGHHAAPAVSDADEEDVHDSTSRRAASGSGTTR